ncbi:unnamed protein product [Schistosoma margrebowiei]|uniref:Uncharacterized protein n=1 Tax=Schistosoma margrebowiei TaxID=48269 RepID=A0A183MD97_9TREM|nr:unnamed protein product [Schistosoma margrebowiei]
MELFSTSNPIQISRSTTPIVLNELFVDFSTNSILPIFGCTDNDGKEEEDVEDNDDVTERSLIKLILNWIVPSLPPPSPIRFNSDDDGGESEDNDFELPIPN